MGFEDRMDYGTVGNLPDMAARLCAEAKGGQVLTEPIEALTLKGISRPITAFNIISARR